MKVKGSRVHTTKAALYGFVVLVLFWLLASSVTTQWLAEKFAYQAALGQRGAFGLYHPLAWIDWTWRYYRSARETFGSAYLGFMIAFLVSGLTYVLAVGFGTRSIKQHEGLHGTAHWATEDEIRESGLLPQPGRSGAGVYVGGWRDPKGRLHYLRHNGPEHIAAIAPTRSGKGVGLVVPTLLSWPHSVVVNDQKAELWAMTSGWRQQVAGNRVLKFDPASPSGSVAFNPLEEVRVGTIHEVGDVQNLVTIIVDPEGKGMSDHWSKTAHAFLTGLIIHLGYIARAQGRSATLPDVVAALSDPNRDVKALYEEMRQNKHVNGTPHKTVAEAASDMLNRAENERSGVLSTAMSYLSLYRDPLVARNVSRSDFKISDLMNFTVTDAETGEVRPVPVSLYLVVRAEDKDRMRPLMRLVINQIIRVLLRPEIQFENGRAIDPHLLRLLMMLDEFPSYGRLDVFQEALAYIAGHGIKAYLIMQDIAQLQAAYGRDESILSNCHVRVAYAPNRIETGKWLSDNSGVTTVLTEKISTSGSRFGFFLTSANRSFQETSRPLLTADEAMRLAPPKKDGKGNIERAGAVLVYAAGQAPIQGEQSLYFMDREFTERVSIPPPAASDRLREAPAPRSPPPAPTPSQAGGFGEYVAARKGRAAAPLTEPPGAPRPATQHTRTRRAQTHRALEKARHDGAAAAGDYVTLFESDGDHGDTEVAE